MNDIKIQTVIVDDELLAVKGIVSLLTEEADFEVCAACTSPKEALKILQQSPPDLLFLDIQMPGMDGFQLLQELAPFGLPQVVFVTAFDNFAVRAFEECALDYLLKPVDENRFQTCLQRIRQRLSSEDAGKATQAVRARLEQEYKHTPYLETVHAKAAGVEARVKVAEIEWVEARQNYLLFHCGAKEVLSRMTMADLEAQLDPDLFYRIHRGALLRLNCLEELRSASGLAVLRSGAELTVSRARRAGIKDAWNLALRRSSQDASIDP